MLTTSPADLLREELSGSIPCEGCTLLGLHPAEAVVLAVFEITCCQAGYLLCSGHRDRTLLADKTGTSWRCHYCKADIGRLLRFVPL